MVGSRLGPMWSQVALSVVLLVTAASPLRAQASPPAQEPPLRRWFEIQNVTVYSRYRFVESSADVTTSNQAQYKDTFRARFNIDSDKRYTVNVGYFSGNSFIGSWNNWGVGTGNFDGKDHYMKQLYASATPIRGLELQYGGLYVTRGENDEFTTYDDDGFLVGERASVRLPRTLYLDEISVTRGGLGPFSQPNLASRWEGLAHPNYLQVLGAKRFNHVLAGSLDYSTQSGADTVRVAITVKLDKIAPFSTLRYEQYRRVTNHPAAGFALWTEQAMSRHARLQWGYATIDQFYGGWNADRIQSGRRFFGIATIAIHGPLSASLFATQALPSSYPITLKRRLDAVFLYDVLASLRGTGIF